MKTRSERVQEIAAPYRERQRVRDENRLMKNAVFNAIRQPESTSVTDRMTIDEGLALFRSAEATDRLLEARTKSASTISLARD